MSYYYPQAVMTLRVIWEDFDLKSDASLQKVYTLPIIARRITVNFNDYTTADTFDCEIEYKNFPFDPRCIRSCGVTIHMQDMKTIFRDDNALNIIEPSDANTIFQGFVDEESLKFDDDKRVVRFEGRDFTALLIDAKYLEGKPLDQGQPLDVLLAGLLTTLKSVQQLKVDNRTGKTLPALKQFYPDFGSPLAGQKNTGRDDTYWEIIQDLSARAGLIAYVELDKLVISTPRVLYNKSNAKQFVYGTNIKNLEFKRKLGRQKGFNIIVRCLDLQTKTVIDAKIPEEATDDWCKDTGVSKKRVQVPVIKPDGTQDVPKDAPFMAFRVTNIADKQHLIGVGEKIYEELSRQQIEGSFETHEMETPDKTGTCFDLTKLRIGTPVAIEIDQGDLAGISRLTSVSQRERFLTDHCYEPVIARAFAKSMGKFMPVFYTKGATFTLDADTGYKLKIDFLNFIDLDNKGIDFG